jgi:hypothetical protein
MQFSPHDTGDALFGRNMAQRGPLRGSSGVLSRLHVVACNGWVVRQGAGAPMHEPTNSIFLGRSELGNDSTGSAN